MRKNGLRVVRCGLRVSVSPFTTRYSPIAAVSRLADLPTSRLADKFWEGEHLGEPKSVPSSECGVQKSENLAASPLVGNGRLTTVRGKP